MNVGEIALTAIIMAERKVGKDKATKREVLEETDKKVFLALSGEELAVSVCQSGWSGC